MMDHWNPRSRYTGGFEIANPNTLPFALHMPHSRPSLPPDDESDHSFDSGSTSSVSSEFLTSVLTSCVAYTDF